MKPIFWPEVKTENDLWAKAMQDAWVIMGPVDPRDRPRRRDPGYRHKADADPLACWLLVELVVSYAQKGKAVL